MRLLIVAVGQRIPDWAQTAWDDYAKRFPPELKVELKAVKTEPRGSISASALKLSFHEVRALWCWMNVAHPCERQPWRSD